jgi:hypothetical protein
VITPRRATVALIAWTWFVWLTRVRNIAGDGSLSGAEKVVPGLLAASFVVLAAVVLWTALRSHPRRREALLALGGWTVVVWLVRGVGIATGGHSAAFVIVHLMLAAVSIGLSWLALRAPRRFSATAANH